MSLITMVLAATLTQAAPAPLVSAAATSEDAGLTDVAYSELVAGDADAAVRKLEDGSANRSDPALLINLGAAYARQGATDKALVAYRAAIDSPQRYDLELASGRWMDSREVARHALANLQRSRLQARR